MNNELITIIIPVKNGSNYIHEAIEGIKKQGMDVEIIVVDDASDDNTTEIAKSMGCKIIRHETTKGHIAARNTGLKAANGKFILFHDHDDVMNEGALQELCNAFDKDTQVVMARVKDFISPDCKDNNLTIKKEPYWGLFTGAVLIKKSVFEQIGLFECHNLSDGVMIAFKQALDAQNIEIKKIDYVASNYRIHNANFGRTNNQAQKGKDYASILRAKLTRG